MGLADDRGDCNNDEALAFPGGTEIAGDDVHQDCDGVSSCFVDGDGDGFGTPLTADFATPSGPTPGASTFDNDRDDDVASGGQRSPGHPEVPGNDLDEDCSLTYGCFLDADDDGFAPLPTSIVDGPDVCDLALGGAGAAAPPPPTPPPSASTSTATMPSPTSPPVAATPASEIPTTTATGWSPATSMRTTTTSGHRHHRHHRRTRRGQQLRRRPQRRQRLRHPPHGSPRRGPVRGHGAAV